MTSLAEIVVKEHGNSTAKIAHTTRRWFPWVVFLVVVTGDDEKSGWKDPTYGYSGFKPVRSLQRFCVDDITFYGKKCGIRHRRAAAEKHAERELNKFLRWLDRQKRIERELAEH